MVVARRTLCSEPLVAGRRSKSERTTRSVCDRKLQHVVAYLAARWRRRMEQLGLARHAFWGNIVERAGRCEECGRSTRSVRHRDPRCLAPLANGAGRRLEWLGQPGW